MEDVFKGIETAGKLLSHDERAKHLADSLRRELKRLTGSLAHQLASSPKVLAITWQDPTYCYGQNTLFTDEIKLAGAQNAVADTFLQPYPALARDYILQLNPNVLLGGSFGKLDSTFFKNYPELKRINAYRNRRVFAITSNLLERPGPCVVESVSESQKPLKIKNGQTPSAQRPSFLIETLSPCFVAGPRAAGPGPGLGAGRGQLATPPHIVSSCTPSGTTTPPNPPSWP